MLDVLSPGERMERELREASSLWGRLHDERVWKNSAARKMATEVKRKKHQGVSSEAPYG